MGRTKNLGLYVPDEECREKPSFTYGGISQDTDITPVTIELDNSGHIVTQALIEELLKRIRDDDNDFTYTTKLIGDYHANPVEAVVSFSLASPDLYELEKSNEWQLVMEILAKYQNQQAIDEIHKRQGWRETNPSISLSD